MYGLSATPQNNAVQHYYVRDNGLGRETIYVVTRLLSTDFYWFVELVHVGRLRKKVLLTESPLEHVSCYSGRRRNTIIGVTKWQFRDGLYADLLF
jgi:hypothetical protein